MAGKKNTTSGVYVMYRRPVFSNVVLTNKNFDKHYRGALLYAHNELSSNELKKEVAKYLKSIDAKHPLLDRIKDIHENRLAIVGKYMYILNHGGNLPPDVLPSVMPALEKVVGEEEAKAAAIAREAKYNASKNPTADVAPKAVVSIQDRLRDRAREVSSEIEGWIDEFISDKKLAVKPVDDFVNLFKASDLKGPHMKYVHTAFAARAEHMALVADGKDKLLLEGYSNFTKPELKKLSQFFQNLISAVGMMQEVAKVERGPRKKKPVSQEKMVAKMKFKKDDPTLSIVSMYPIQLLGAKEAWVYNTKTRKLAQYKALDERGLLVKGTSIDNISSDSREKLLRKPAETLAEFRKTSKVKLRTFLEELGTVDVEASGRMNEFCIILRIDK